MMVQTLRQSPHFADCPVAGAALRVLHVWAAASYHHALQPSVAFATESPELPFTPELRWLGFIFVERFEVMRSVTASPADVVFVKEPLRKDGGVQHRTTVESYLKASFLL